MSENKKSILKITTTVVLIAVLAILIILNRRNASANDAMAADYRLEIESPTGRVEYVFDENDANFTGFDTQMRRKNGDVFDKHYSGIEFRRILEELGTAADEDTDCVFVCADQYEIKVEGNELLEPGNVWLVTREDGQPLDEEQGPFMLVINNDEFSTRWGRQIVKIKIGE
ncbi:MAG: molybdopterin-dependent oxidoreductase [Lachnospiraceae bacterium]|nr:molybdopterin-dependent oxidoreductase [Lachnospiraceae bacterium]